MILRYTIGIDIKYDKESLNTYKKVSPGQFVIHLRSFQGGFAYSEIEGITSPAYTVIDFKNKENYYPIFWRSILTSTTFIKKLETVTYGIRDGRSISFKDFSSLKFNVPKYNEQTKIGHLLKSLDDTIILHQAAIQRQQDLKKAMLQQLFPIDGTTIPTVRFASFTEEWQQRKLKYFIEDYIEKTTIQNEFPVLTSSQKQGIVLQEDYFTDRQVTTQNNAGYYILPKGYFTYRSRSDNGIFKFNRNDLIDKGIISYFYPVFKIINGDSDFFLQLLNTTIKKQVALESVGTGQRVLSLKKFKNIEVCTPNEREQKKIGAFFKSLDDTITLHQQALVKLKLLKQSLLQKMFVS